MSFVVAAFGPLGTAELLIILFLFGAFGAVTAIAIGVAIYLGKRSKNSPSQPPPCPPAESRPPDGENS